MAASIASSVGNVAVAAAKAIGSNFSSLAQDTATAAFPFLKGMSSYMKTDQTSTDYNKASDTVSNEGGFKLLDDSLSDIHQAIKMGNELLGGVREDVGEIRKLLQNFGGNGGPWGSNNNGGKGDISGSSIANNVENAAVGYEILNILKKFLPAVGGVLGKTLSIAAFAADFNERSDSLVKQSDEYKKSAAYKTRIVNENYDAKDDKIKEKILGNQQELNYTKSLEEQAMTAEEKTAFSKREADIQKDINELLEQQKALLEQRNKAIAYAVTQSQAIPTASSGSTGVGAASSGSPGTVGSTYGRGNFGGAKPDLDDGTTQVLRRVGGASGADQNAFPAQSASDYLRSKGIDPSKVPAGVHNNNPANLKYYGIGWVGETGPSENKDEGTPQSVFSSPDDGMRAGLLNLVNQYKKGATTIEKLAPIYSPSNVSGAIKNFSQFSGFKPDEDLKLTDKDRLVKFFKGVVQQEQGSNKYYDDEMYNRGADRALGLGKYAGAVGNTAETNNPKSKEDVLDHLDSMKRRGMITNEQCVSLASAAVGIRLGSGQDGSFTSQWRSGGNITGQTSAGTPVATFLGGTNSRAAYHEPSNLYAGGTGGVAGIDRDHAAVLTGNYKYDHDGNVIAAEITDQSAGHGWQGQSHWVTATGPEGTGGEKNLNNYKIAMTSKGYLGGNNNPEKRRIDALAKANDKFSNMSGRITPLGDKDFLSKNRNSGGRNDVDFPVESQSIPRMSRDMFMNQGDNTDLKNLLISKGIMPDKKDPLDTLLDQYQAHDHAKFKNMVGRKIDLAEFTKYDLYSNMKGRTSGPSTTNNIYGNHDNKENPLTPHKKKGNIPPVAPPDHVIHKLFTVKAPNGAYSGGGIGHM